MSKGSATLSLLLFIKDKKMTGRMLFASVICQLKKNNALVFPIICQGRTLVSLPGDSFSREIILLNNATFLFLHVRKVAQMTKR